MNVVRRTQKRGVLVGTSLLVLAAACSSQVNPAEQESVGSQRQGVISTTLSTYAVGSTVVVNYDAMQGAPSDWVAISEVGSPDTAFLKWAYTGGGAAGSRSFSGLPGGSYEARAYFDWAGTSSYTVQYRSSFSIQGTGAAVLTPPASVAVNAPVQIAYSGMPGNTTDWIAVAAAGAPATSYLRWTYTNGAASGATNFAGLPAGNYVARAFYDYKNTSSFAVQAEAPFTVSIGGSPSLTPPASPGASTQLNIAFANFPGHATDWVTVAAAGSADTAFIRYKYTNGALSGTADLGTLPDGNYETRGYANWAGTQSYAVIARQAFTVSSCTAETDPAFCARVGKNCGAVSGTDNCGAARTVNDCGTCTSPQTCGGAGTANVCSCAPETDAAFCSRLGKNCGSVSGTDTCGAARTVNDCGTCTSPQTCGGGGAANVCGAPATGFSRAFTAGENPATSGACTDWTAWRTGLSASKTYTSITFSSSLGTSRACTGTAANTLCQALRQGISSAVDCNGVPWGTGGQAGSCSNTLVTLSAGTSLTCQCGTATLRPCFNQVGYFGGLASACNEGSQTLSVVCQ